MSKGSNNTKIQGFINRKKYEALRIKLLKKGQTITGWLRKMVEAELLHE